MLQPTTRSGGVIAQAITLEGRQALDGVGNLAHESVLGETPGADVWIRGTPRQQHRCCTAQIVATIFQPSAAQSVPVKIVPALKVGIGSVLRARSFVIQRPRIFSRTCKSSLARSTS